MDTVLCQLTTALAEHFASVVPRVQTQKSPHRAGLCSITNKSCSLLGIDNIGCCAVVPSIWLDCCIRRFFLGGFIPLCSTLGVHVFYFFLDAKFDWHSRGNLSKRFFQQAQISVIEHFGEEHLGNANTDLLFVLLERRHQVLRCVLCLV